MKQEEKLNNGSAPLSLEQRKHGGHCICRILHQWLRRVQSRFALSLGNCKGQTRYCPTVTQLIYCLAVLLHTLGKIFGGSIADMLGGKNILLLCHLIMGMAYAVKRL